jgi:transcriptional regulator NrdR family protein
VRYASVYRDFKEVEDFSDFIKEHGLSGDEDEDASVSLNRPRVT